MNAFERRNSLLGMEFDRYIREHPEFGERIPDNAQVILLLEGDEDFNGWSIRIGKEQTESGCPIVYVTIKKLGRAHSRIEGLELVTG